MEGIHIAILENYQGIIDGYHYRFNHDPAIKITAEARFGQELEEMLDSNQVDILLIEPCVPVSETNSNQFPVWSNLSSILKKRPFLKILVITGTDNALNVKNAVDIGVNGYIFKEDAQTIRTLAAVVKSIATGGFHYSRKAHEILQESMGNSMTLTARQLHALSLAAAYPNETSKELARRMKVAPSTFRSILTPVYDELNVRSRLAAVEEARRRGWIT